MIKEVAAIVSILVGVAGIVALTHRMLLHSQASGIKQFELFLRLQQLCGTDARYNLPALRVALSCFTKRVLTTTEIEWFLFVPGAFFYLRAYVIANRTVTSGQWTGIVRKSAFRYLVRKN